VFEDVQQREQVVGVHVRVHQDPPRRRRDTGCRYRKEPQHGHGHHRRPCAGAHRHRRRRRRPPDHGGPSAARARARGTERWLAAAEEVAARRRGLLAASLASCMTGCRWGLRGVLSLLQRLSAPWASMDAHPAAVAVQPQQLLQHRDRRVPVRSGN
jgi:hypothetical protein